MLSAFLMMLLMGRVMYLASKKPNNKETAKETTNVDTKMPVKSLIISFHSSL
jgi:hypothetical protein